MLKKIFNNHFVIAGIIVFLLMFFIGIFGISLSWSESLLLAAVITVVGVGAMWWQDFWPFWAKTHCATALNRCSSSIIPGEFQPSREVFLGRLESYLIRVT